MRAGVPLSLNKISESPDSKSCSHRQNTVLLNEESATSHYASFISMAKVTAAHKYGDLVERDTNVGFDADLKQLFVFGKRFLTTRSESNCNSPL